MEKEYLDNILKIYFSGSGSEDLAIEIAHGLDEDLYLSLKEGELKDLKFNDTSLNISDRKLIFSNCTFINIFFSSDVSSFIFERCHFENCFFDNDIYHYEEIFLACEIVNSTFMRIRFDNYFLRNIDDFTNLDNLIKDYMSQFKNCKYFIYCNLGRINKEIDGDALYKRAIKIISNYNILEEIDDYCFKNWTFKNIKNQSLESNSEDCVFENCNLGSIDIYYDYPGCKFIECDYRISSFGPVDRRYFEFSEMDFTGRFIDEDLCLGIMYENIILKDAVLTDNANFDLLIDASDFSGVNLEGKILAEFDFEGKIMDEVNFKAADLTDVNFRNASLCFADFTDANLQGADFTGADLRGVIFEGADLTGAIFDEAIISESMGNKKLNYFYADRPRSALFRKTEILRA
jgi:uncharacterized protein YjbI with pentapeptide repeats